MRPIPGGRCEWQHHGIVSLPFYTRYINRIKEDVRVKIVRKWCRQILEGLCYMHSLDPPLPHGDVRLGNIFINGETGDVRLGSFRWAARHTKSGTPTDAGRYLPPEGEEATLAGDIYSFGLCVLQMVTREPPYWESSGETFSEMMAAKRQGKLPKNLDDFEIRSDVRCRCQGGEEEGEEEEVVFRRITNHNLPPYPPLSFSL